MAGIKDSIKDILTRLNTIEEIKYVRVWNNHIQRMKDRSMEAFALPAALVEIEIPEQMVSIGLGVVAADLKIRVHVIHEFYDAGDGTMGQNLDIFDLKDLVVKAFRGYAPVACSMLQRIGESQNMDHDNVYEYLIEYATHMIDSKGSRYDPDDNDFILNTPPIELEVLVQVFEDHLPVDGGLSLQTADGKDIVTGDNNETLIQINL